MNSQKLMKGFSRIILAVIIISQIGCRNYNSEQYINIENQAINDIISEMANLDEIIKMNNLNTKDLKLFLISSLDTVTSTTYKPEGYTVAINGVKLSEKEIQENKKRFEEDFKKYEKEEKLFAPIKNGTIKKRHLDYKFKCSNLKIELIPENKVYPFGLKQNEFGYLYVSRIIFNKSFEKGYLSYSFFCGEGCAWDNNIEIKKVAGKWKITKYFSGGIA